MYKLILLLISLALVALFFLAAWTFVIVPTVTAFGASLPF